MKILLVNPYSLSDCVTPPLGLGFLAAAVKDIASVDIVDFIREEQSDPAALLKVLRRESYALVGFKILHANYELVKEYLALVRREFPQIITVAGGPQAAILRDETIAYYGDALDFAVAGEGEVSFRALVEVLQRRQCNRAAITSEELAGISGLSTCITGTAISNAVTFSTDISEYAIDWDVLRPDTYPPIPHAAFARRFPVTSISVSRGCPFHCTFCAAFKVVGRKVRYRAVRRVLDEMVYLYQRYGVREFQIIDDNFTCSKAYVLEFCAALAARKMDILWSLPNGTRIDSLDDEMLAAMRAAGLYSMSVGIESGSPRVLQVLRKNLDLEKAADCITLIKRHGITVAGFFILGSYTETRAEMLETIRYALRVPLDRAQFMLFHPYPGTESHEQVCGQLTRPLGTTFAEVAYVPEGMTERELKNLQRTAFLRFYLRPRQMYALLRDILLMQGKIHILRRMFRWLT